MSRLDKYNQDGSINHNFDADASVTGGAIDQGMRLLIRATQWLWYWQRSQDGETPIERVVFDEAIETMVKAKTERRAELLILRREQAEIVRKRFASR